MDTWNEWQDANDDWYDYPDEDFLKRLYPGLNHDDAWDRFNDEYIRGPKEFFRGCRGDIDDNAMATYYFMTGIRDPETV